MTPDPATDRWLQNLQALRLVDPTCADRLANLAIPDTVQPATGRDASPTWRIRRNADRVEWFGRTSMPTVSAENLLTGFNPGVGNVALSGIGSGRDAWLLARRLGAHRAIVVLETDPLNLALALRLWDLAGPLRDQRIVLLLAEDLDGLREGLLAFCREHPGFDIPNRMIAWPWRTKAENQAYQGLLELAINQLQQSRNQTLLQQLTEIQQARRPGTAPDAIAVLTTVPGILHRRLADSLADGARAADMAAVACVPESPRNAGPLAGLAAAAKLACDGRHVQIVLLEQCRHHWPLAGADLPLVSWLITVEPDNDGWKFPAGRNDLAVVSTHCQQELLLERGWPADRVLYTPAFVTPRAFETPLDGPREGILLLSDLAPEDKEQAGIKLYSHQVLWDTLRDRLDKQGDTWTPNEAQRWLLAAQSTTGIDLADEAVQADVIDAIRTHLAPSVLLSRVARAIRQAGLPLRVAGLGWDRHNWAKDIWDGPSDDPQQRRELLARVKVAIVGNCRPGPVWTALDAAGAGAAIMSRAFWANADPTHLFDANQQMLVWRTRQELIERLRHLLGNVSSRSKLTQQARQRAMQRYSAAVPLRRVLERIGKA